MSKNNLRLSVLGFRRDNGGGTLIESALTLSVLFAMLFCFMEICLALYARSVIAECAREGARYAMVHGASCPTASNPTCEATAAQVNAYVSAMKWPNLAGGTMTVATTYTNGTEAVGSPVQVKVTYAMTPNMPFVPRATITMSSISQATIEQ
jgi:Flp pilus assembly protein TadG